MGSDKYLHAQGNADEVEGQAYVGEKSKQVTRALLAATGEQARHCILKQVERFLTLLPDILVLQRKYVLETACKGNMC